MRGQASSWLLTIGLATWLLAGLVPDGLRICNQADGRTEFGLGCPCKACDVGDSQFNCCGRAECPADQPATRIAAHNNCCSCSEISLVPNADRHRTHSQYHQQQLVVGSVQPVLTPVRVAYSVQRSDYRPNAPPGAWSPDTIRLLI